MAFIIPQAQLKCDGSEALDPDAAAGMLQELEQHDALYVSEGDHFEEVVALARSFPALDTLQRARLWEVLSANVTSLSSSIAALLEEWEAAQPDAVLRHKNSLNMYLYLMHGLAAAAQAEAEAQRAEQQRQQSKTGAAKPRGKAAGRQGGAQGVYSWPAAQEELLRTLTGVLCLDLATLYKGLTALERGVLLVLDLAMQAASDPAAAKVADVRATAVELLCLVGIKYGRVEEVAAALFRLATGQEHGPELVAAVVKAAETGHNNSQMAVALVCQFSLVAPSEYQPSSSTAKHAGQLLALLAEVSPRAVNSQLSQLQPYLACKAATIRAGLVSAVGSVLQQLYHTEAVSAAAPAGALAAHTRSKEHLLSLLSSRLLDKDSYVRQRTLHTWAALVPTPVVPLPMWNVLLNLALGRMEDSSSKVVKAALQLVFAMITCSPFGARLAPAAFAATLAQQEALLEEMAPAAAEGEGEVWRSGTVQVKEEPQEASEGGAPPASPAPPTPQQTDPAFDGKLQRLRALVASLREALAFAARLEAAMPQLAQLLCYPATDVVQNTIALLTLAERFQVPGAGASLRSMWPLVFSKEEAVRGAVLDSWHRLTLADASPAAQVELLLTQLLPRSTLAELTALEAIFKALAAKDAAAAATSAGGSGMLLDVPALLHQVLAQTCRCYTQLKEGGAAAEAADGGGGQELVGRLRSCFTLVALLAAADPAHVASQWEVLLEAGFSASVQDAWVMTQCATAFTHMAPHLPGSPAALLLPDTPPAAATKLSAAAAAAASGDGGGAGSEEASCCPKVLSKMLRVLLAPPGEGWAGNWASVAQAVVAAVYQLHPAPHVLMAEVLQRAAQVAASTSGEGKAMSGGCLGRFFFLLGATALQQLLLVERLAKAIAKRRSGSSAPAAAGGDGDAGGAAGEHSEDEEAAGGGGGRGRAAAAAAKKAAAAAAAAEKEDIAAQLGVGGGSDLQIDLLVQQVEMQIMATSGLLGRYGRLLSGYCASKALLSAPEEVVAAALLALTQCMAADMRFCADNVALVFTLLVQRLVPPAVRCNLMTALADLASRWPNVLEPWTPHMYSPLTDADPAVKRCALTALTHLVLGGVVKAKGRVAKVALLLEDEDPDIKARALLFFDSLSRSGTGSARSSASAVAGASASNPVYNLLPDMLSALVREPGLREEQFRGIMAVLLQKEYVKEKQADALRDKLAVRMEAPGAGPREWRCLAWCIRQLGYSEKGARGLMELTRHYKHALGEPLVFEVFKELADKAKRSGATSAKAAGGGGDLRERAEEWEAELLAGKAAAEEQAAVEEAAARRRAAQEAAAAGGGEDAAEEGGAAAGQEEGTAAAGGGGGHDEDMEVDGVDAESGGASNRRRSSTRVSLGGPAAAAAAAAMGGDGRGGSMEGAVSPVSSSRKRRSGDVGGDSLLNQAPAAEGGEEEDAMEEEEEERIVVMTSQVPEGEAAGEEEDAAADLTAGLDVLKLGRGSSSSRGGGRGRRGAAEAPSQQAKGSSRSSKGRGRQQQQQVESEKEGPGADEDGDGDDVSAESDTSSEEEEQVVEKAPARGRRSAAAPPAAAPAAAAKRSSTARGAVAAGGRRKQVWIAESDDDSD